MTSRTSNTRSPCRTAARLFLVRPVRLARTVPPDPKDPLVLLARMAHLAQMARPDPKALLDLPVNPAPLVRKVPLVSQVAVEVSQVRKDPRVSLVLRASLALPAHPVILARLATLVLWVLLARLARLVSKARPATAPSKDRPESRDHPESKVPPDPKARPVPTAPWKVRLVPLAKSVRRVIPVRPVSLARPDPRALLVR